MSWVKFHFLNVGAGDCTIIHFPSRKIWRTKTKSERIMVIDFCHHEDHDEYEHLLNYYKENFRDHNWKPKKIFRYVCTHPHHDHICWLHKVFDDEEIEILNFWCVEHNFEPDSFDGHSRHKNDWNTYSNIKDKETNLTVLHLDRDTRQWDFWWDHEDRITILSPSSEMIKEAHTDKDGNQKDSSDIDIDHLSYALLIQINDIKVILWGDSRLQVWETIKEIFKNEIKNIDVLKAPHHWHYSAFEKKNWEESVFVDEVIKYMNPKYIVFSNSEEEDNKYWAENEYKKACPNSTILKTHSSWSIVMQCSFDGDISI